MMATPRYVVGAWDWIYNTMATIRQGACKNTGDEVLKAKL